MLVGLSEVCGDMDVVTKRYMDVPERPHLNPPAYLSTDGIFLHF